MRSLPLLSPRMQRPIRLLQFCALAALLSATMPPVSAEILRLTHSVQLDSRPQINQVGQVTWESFDGKDWEILIWDGASIQQLTDNDQDDRNPQINNAGQVAWEGGNHVYLWDGSTVRQLSTRPVSDARQRLNDAGQVVWQGSDGTTYQVFLWNGSSVQQLSHGGGGSSYPQIDRRGRVVWRQYDGTSDHQIFWWNGSSVQLVSGTCWGNDIPHMNAEGEIVWTGRPENQPAILLGDGVTIRQIKLRVAVGSTEPYLSDAGHVAWVDGPRTYMWDGSSIQTIDADLGFSGMQINKHGHLLGHYGGRITLWRDLSGPAFTLPAESYHAEMNDAGQVVWQKGSEIYRYTPSVSGSVDLEVSLIAPSASTTGTVSLNVPAPAGGATVTLTSADPTVVSVPAQITIPPGAVSATFPVTTRAVTASTSVVITARYSGETWTATLRVKHVSLATFTTEAPRIAGGLQWRGTVTIDGVAPPPSAEITFTSDNPRVVSIHSHDAVVTGRSTTSVTASTSPVQTVTTVRLTASCGGVTRTIILEVLPPLASLTLEPPVVRAGATVVGTIALSGPAPSGGRAVGLSSGNPAAVELPPHVIVPAGASSATFIIKTRAVLSATLVPIWAAAGHVQTARLWVLPMGLSLTPATVRGGKYSTGTILLPAPAPAGGTAVTLSSSDPSAAIPPSTVRVPAGARLVTFAVRTRPVKAATTVTLSATDGVTTWTGSLQVQPPQLLSVSLSPGAVFTNGTAIGILRLDGPAPEGGVTIRVRSIEYWAASAPESVTVAAGQTTASFVVKASPRAGESSRINADYDGTYVADTLYVLAPIASVSVSAPAVTAGATVTGTVTLSGPAPAGGLAVGLSTTDPATVILPARVIVPAGATTATFPITGRSVATATVAPIWAARGVVRTGHLWVLPVGLSLTPSTVRGGKYSTATIVLPAPAPAGGATVTLRSADPAAVAVPVSITVPAGSTRATFPVRSAPVADTRAVVLTASYAGASWTSALQVQHPRPVTVSVAPVFVTKGHTATGTVTLDGPAPAGGLQLALASSLAGSTFPGRATVPQTVTVPAGATTATFLVTTPPPSGPSDMGMSSVDIRASYGGATAKGGLTVAGP